MVLVMTARVMRSRFFQDLVRVRAVLQHGLFGLAELGRRDHFHGLGDLLRALDARDPILDFF